MQNQSSFSHFTIPHSKNMPAKYNNESSYEFYEVSAKQSSSVGQPPKQHAVNKKKSVSQINRCLMPQQRITAWSSSSSSSSLTTGSLFSLPDYSSSSKRFKTTGSLFNNLDLVPHNPKIDPRSFVCFNCWRPDHKHNDCPKIKIHKYCINCGRRGVIIKECPRCARAYIDYSNQLNTQCNVYISSIKVNNPIDDVHLNITKEKYNEYWDDYVDDHSPDISFSDTLQKRETEYQNDDWDNYQSPRANLMKKSNKLYSLNTTKAEVAKYKDDNWSDCEFVSYSYSWGEHNYKTESTNYIDSKVRVNKVAAWDCFEKNDNNCFSQNLETDNEFKSFNTSENNRAEYHTEETLKNSEEESAVNIKTTNLIINSKSKLVDEIVFETDSKEKSIGICKTTNFISNRKENLVNQNNSMDQNGEIVEKSEKSYVLEIKKQNFNILQNKNIQDQKEEWSDSEAYKSLQTSFCEESEIDNHITTVNNNRVDEEYWTDFDDDYESFQASFAEEYKSLDSTIENEDDCTNTFITEIPNNEGKSQFYDSFYANSDSESNQLFSFIENEKIDDLLAKQSYDKNFYKVNSLENSVGSQSDEAYLSNDEDIDDYEYMIVDENERSETLPFAGQTVQDFLNLLDTLKHLPIQIQNVAVFHFISQQKEQSYKDQMQNRP